MKRKWFALAPALVVGFGAFAFPSQARADDYCASPYTQQQVYVDGYAQGYGYARPYEQHGYARPYERPGTYDQGGYGYDRPYQRPYREQYSQPYSSYDRDDYGYGYGYGAPTYGGATVHEDHIRTTFRLFPFPHIDKRVVHHHHPVY